MRLFSSRWGQESMTKTMTTTTMTTTTMTTTEGARANSRGSPGGWQRHKIDRNMLVDRNMFIERFTAGVSREKFEPLPRVPTNQIRAVTTTCTAAPMTALLARTTKNGWSNEGCRPEEIYIQSTSKYTSEGKLFYFFRYVQTAKEMTTRHIQIWCWLELRNVTSVVCQCSHKITTFDP